MFGEDATHPGQLNSIRPSTNRSASIIRDSLEQNCARSRPLSFQPPASSDSNRTVSFGRIGVSGDVTNRSPDRFATNPGRSERPSMHAAPSCGSFLARSNNTSPRFSPHADVFAKPARERGIPNNSTAICIRSPALSYRRLWPYMMIVVTRLAGNLRCFRLASYGGFELGGRGWHAADIFGRRLHGV